jgi:peptidoglycan hydrolase CwlO-like protein
MARGRKSYTLEERLQNITDEIDSLDAKIKELKKEKKNLEDQVRQERLVKLDELMTERGLSFEDVEKKLSE